MATMLKSPAVAQRLGVHEDTLQRWRRRTENGTPTGPPFLRVGANTVLYDQDALEQWIKERTVAA